MRYIEYIALGLILMVFGFFLMTKLHQRTGYVESVLATFFELVVDTVISLLAKDFLPGAGTIALLMVLVGFFMIIINIVQLVGRLGH